MQNPYVDFPMDNRSNKKRVEEKMTVHKVKKRQVHIRCFVVAEGKVEILEMLYMVFQTFLDRGVVPRS